MRKLRTTVYARMEEMSFRSGAAAGAGALAVVGTAIALAVTLTGHSAAATSVPGPATPARSAPSVLQAGSASVDPVDPVVHAGQVGDACRVVPGLCAGVQRHDPPAAPVGSAARGRPSRAAAASDQEAAESPRSRPHPMGLVTVPTAAVAPAPSDRRRHA